MVTLTAEQPKTMSAEEFDVYALLPQNRDRLLHTSGERWSRWFPIRCHRRLPCWSVGAS